MGKYVKKPIVVEAVQWNRHGDHPAVHHTAYDTIPGLRDAVTVPENHAYGYIDTLEGRMLVSRGDFIIQGVKGEFYPCKPDIFEATYEAVETCEAA